MFRLEKWSLLEMRILKKKFNRREFNYAVFSRDFNLPETADSNKIYAEYKDGILKIRISKKEELKIQARAISIQ